MFAHPRWCCGKKWKNFLNAGVSAKKIRQMNFKIEKRKLRGRILKLASPIRQRSCSALKNDINKNLLFLKIFYIIKLRKNKIGECGASTTERTYT